ncbi:MAG TPA: Rrf2 family transcriptional regulator [Chitinophagaceae bacterium]|jgi:Rrf2 family protein
MFSKTCEYAIRAMIFIAQQSKNGHKTGIKEVAKGINAPEFFIGKILQDLSKTPLLQSFKGPTGGFYLDDESLKSSLADIVQAVDGDKLFSGCGLGMESCSETTPCPIHHEFKIVRQEIYRMLHAAKLNDLQKNLESKIAFLKQK